MKARLRIARDAVGPCQGQRTGREALKGRNLLWISYTLYSGLLLLLGCRSAIQRAACYA